MGGVGNGLPAIVGGLMRIVADNVSFSYPIFDIGARSLKVSLFKQMSGGSVTSRSNVVHVDALQNLSFQLKDGDRLGLIGRNGAGKSTLLRLLAGLAHPTSGVLKANGRIIPLLHGAMGINPELSGRDNIKLPLRLLGATSREVRMALDEIPEFTGLGPFIDLPVRTYSDGMRARLSFAICTALEADILVLDEWLGAGDMDFQQKAQERLTAFVANTGVVVLASHSNDLIAAVCNQGLWLSQGRQIISGEVGLVVNAYKSSTSLQDHNRRAA